MYPASITLFWRDKMREVTDEETGEVTTEPYPPVTQDVNGFFVEGNALILVQDKQSSYLIPLDILDAVSIFAREVEVENDSESVESEGEKVDGTVLTPDFGGSDEGS